MLETILSIVVALIGVLGGVLFPKLFAWLNAKGKEAKLKTGLDAAFVVVRALEEAYAKAKSDGRPMLLPKAEMGALKIQQATGCTEEEACLLRDAAVQATSGMGAAEKALRAALKKAD